MAVSDSFERVTTSHTWSFVRSGTTASFVPSGENASPQPPQTLFDIVTGSVPATAPVTASPRLTLKSGKSTRTNVRASGDKRAMPGVGQVAPTLPDRTSYRSVP